ncbi:lipocalin-like [Anolis carolinensis]|uniref:lipocalin-like n=1 Tax=Anolis carolinensis TaxID=28377 RepID=UPI002F2B4A09
MTTMRPLVLSVAWAFACSSWTAAVVPVHPDFDPWQLFGWWNPICLVTDINTVDLSIVGKMITPLENGDLDIDFEYVKGGKCFVNVNRFLSSKLPGIFVSDKGYVIHIVETDYEEYNIFHMDIKGQKILYLDSRETTVSVAVRNRFKNMATALGFAVGKILYMPQNVPCL